MKTIRFILQFRFDHQLSMTEIARAVRVSQGTVHIILSCARGPGSTVAPAGGSRRRCAAPGAVSAGPVPDPDDRLERDWSVKALTRKRREPKPTRRVLWERYCDDARNTAVEPADVPRLSRSGIVLPIAGAGTPGFFRAPA